MSWFEGKHGKWALESIAVVSSLLYTYLFIEGNMLCWLFAFIGATIYVWLTWRSKIYAESLLQVFYVGMAFYGYFNTQTDFSPKFIMTLSDHLAWLALGSGLLMVSTFILKKEGSAKLPILDSFTTVFSLLATWLMVNNIPSSWLYWIVIDLVAVFLYYLRGMKLTSLLFILYLILAIQGYISVH